MTNLDLYKYILIDLNKVEAPTLLKESYEFFINKAVQQYANKIYNQAEMNLQRLDDISFLKRTVELVSLNKDLDRDKLLQNEYWLPYNYFHLYSCEITYNNISLCNKNSSFGVKKLNSDQKVAIINNSYLKPKFDRVYYELKRASEPLLIYDEDGGILLHTIDNYITILNNSNFEIGSIIIDYLSTPEKITIPDSVNDFYNVDTNDTYELTFSDYIAYEIINETIKLILENSNNTNRLQSSMAVNQSIANLNNNNK